MGLAACLRGHGPKPRTFRGAIDGGRVWWVAPTYKQVQSSEIWEHLKRACAGAWTDKSEVDRSITLPSGGNITVKTAENPDSLRGSGLDGLVVDEAAFIAHDVWKNQLRPALADKQGWAMLMSTPNGKNWFEKLRARAASGRAGWESWQLPSTMNPLFTQTEADSVAEEIGPRAYAQEHLAIATEIEGALFPGDYFEDHIWASRWPDAFDLSCVYCDPSLGDESKDGDYQAVVFAGLSGGLWWIDAWLDRVPPLEFVARCVSIYYSTAPTFFGIEGNGFQRVLAPLFDLYCQRERLAPLPIRLVNNSVKKRLRVQGLDPLFAAKKLRFRRTKGCELLIEQTQMFPNDKYHDDGPDALEGAIRLANVAARQPHAENTGTEILQAIV